jgi:hypothetical protein
MKNILVLLLLLVPGILLAQDNLAGRWHVDVQESLQRNLTSARARYDSLPPEAKTRIESNFNNREFLFRGNGTMVISWTSEQGKKELSGHWEFNENSNILSLRTAGSEGSHRYTVEQLTSTVLVLKAIDARSILQQLYLKRK